ncbi:uncharacterized protein Z519_12813 [Cladophialophora bantiana CBS 173.52]|uniref:Protein kinase domain-containing protein n=1 Tax=Cladophialophora bantiana (strain ATCC 10958 / CBS 173.52 / CDC B-1940 / NIH 8579) TaxID=1442370 RepID=A0A0D2FIR2_CLAB1|nr:uncharacterized protein Z519_12813 [Cladophialophora bantiana CBS 173.52]KIW86582.1 hypothetical protein Z519_12813 [Cladophialophora bantiana CBS 173.52]
MARLHRRYAWAPGDDEARSAWDEFKQTLVLEFQSWYGTDNDNLSKWRSLCRALRIWPIPQSCTECQKAVRGRHVNMVDLLQQRRNGEYQIRIFESLDDLRVRHGDLRLEQWLLDERNARLSDFNGSGFDAQPTLGLKRRSARGLECSSHWLPRPDDVESSEQTDLFALGSSLYELIAGQMPFAGIDDHTIETRYAQGIFPNTEGLLMAPNLAPSQHEMLQHMITDGSLEDEAMAAIAKCSSRTIRTLPANLRRYGNTTTPYIGRGGRPRAITSTMLTPPLELLRDTVSSTYSSMTLSFFVRYFWALDDAGYNKQDSKAGWVVKKSGSASC